MRDENQPPESGELRTYRLRISGTLRPTKKELTGGDIFENLGLGIPDGLTDTSRTATVTSDEPFRWNFAFSTIFSV